MDEQKRKETLTGQAVGALETDRAAKPGNDEAELYASKSKGGKDSKQQSKTGSSQSPDYRGSSTPGTHTF